MSGFASSWLDLREAADARARNRDCADALAGHFAGRETMHIVDLGSGTGANLRATAPLLPDRQFWRLIDHDPQLLSAARERLAAWADSAENIGDTLRLTHEHRSIDVSFELGDLARDAASVLGDEKIDLVTASALFDLASQALIRELAREICRRQAAFYAVLTYNGAQRWAPHRPVDNQIIAAFNRHQMTDKGLGVAAGPTAPTELTEQFRLNGYLVSEGDSPWQLGAKDAALIEELMRGTAEALRSAVATREGQRDSDLTAETIDAWRAVPRTAAFMGHLDVFAVPGGEIEF